MLKNLLLEFAKKLFCNHFYFIGKFNGPTTASVIAIFFFDLSQPPVSGFVFVFLNITTIHFHFTPFSSV